ncbi:MAG: lasso RiPP family leader peptide-containing protein [Gaiellaceae bacterium]
MEEKSPNEGIEPDVAEEGSYEPPRLTAIGTVKELTRANEPTLADSG